MAARFFVTETGPSDDDEKKRGRQTIPTEKVGETIEGREAV